MFQFFKNKSRYVWPSTYLHTLIKAISIETNIKSFYVKTTGGKEQKSDAFSQPVRAGKINLFFLSYHAFYGGSGASRMQKH